MLPVRILEGFKSVPKEVVGLCRPHTWEQLTTPPGNGLRSIRDLLVHMLAAENGWIGHVIRRNPLHWFEPASFTSLDQILATWTPQREATLGFIRGVTTQERHARRPLPWNPSDSATIEEILWHIVTHEQYHRGQISTRLGMLGRRDLPDYDLLRRAAGQKK